MRIKKIFFISFSVFFSIFLILFIYIQTNTYRAAYDDLTWKNHAEIKNNLISFQVEDALANIVFYPGGFVKHDAYAQMGYLLSLEGFNVFIPKMPLNLAILGLSRFESIYESYPSPLPWFIGGHSLGGASASLFVKDTTYPIAGLFFLGAYPANRSDLSNESLKVLSITASLDLILNQENFEKTKLLLPKESVFEVIEGGNHSYFGYYGMQKKDGVATITREQQHNLVVSIIKDWILS